MMWRIYFNYARDFPLVWSVDEGSPESEFIVQHIELHGCTAVTKFADGQQPKAWIEVKADKLLIRGGIAHFLTVASG